MTPQRRDRSPRTLTLMSAVLRALSICAPAAMAEAPTAQVKAIEIPALTADIPAQPLAQALEAFARQTGLQLVYVSEVVSDQRSRAVSAGADATHALGRLLEGTGLRFEYLTPRSVQILAAAAGPPKKSSNPMPEHESLEEVIVTANRREENQQSVPMRIQVLTGETLAKLNTTTFDDFVKYLPAVTSFGVGPEQNNIYVRGLATANGGLQSVGVTGVLPNVAVYLDEQSAQLPGRNLDVYTVDLDRVEILEGPQGTLFGAGAQAGVIRYITNKPKLDVTEGSVNAGYATTAHGGQSGKFDATINLPIIADTLAVRGVIYDERRGGYIDNTSATFARSVADQGIQFGFAGQIPPNSVVINNAALVANAINPVTYTGIRVEALYQFSDDWSALLAQSYQNVEADGVFAEMATNSLGEPQPPLTVQLFNPSVDKDRFENTALTLNGRIGALELLYAGSYLVRNINQVEDYTNYARAVYTDYYQCVNPGPTFATARCFTPSSTWHDLERNSHQSHELRASTPGDWRLRGVGGLFYENYRIQEQVDWFYLTATPFFTPIGPPTGYYTLNGSALQSNGTLVSYQTKGAVFVPAPATSNNPNIRPPDDAFFDDITRGYRQKAAYASVDWDLLPQTLTLTAGTRFFSIDSSEVGSSVGAGDCRIPAPDPCLNRGSINLNAADLDRTSSGFRSRVSLSWKVTADALLYYTWSQGFRPGGFNRPPSAVPYLSLLSANGQPGQELADKHGGWITPASYAPDNLTNNEIGWKTSWLDRRIEWNGSIYQEDWNHAQIAVYDSGVISFGAILNGGDYRVRGVETSGVARVAGGLSVEAAAAWNHSELVEAAPLFWRDGTPIDFGALHLANPGGAVGSPLAGSPPFQGNLRARDEFTLNGYDAFAQIGVVHRAHTLATTNRLTLDVLGNSVAYDLPSFTTYDGALGVGKDGWLVQLYGENLTDTRAQLYANYAQYYKAVTVNRPRTIGIRFGYKFRTQ